MTTTRAGGDEPGQARRWHNERDVTASKLNDYGPGEIVAWVKANGGEARYEPEIVSSRYWKPLVTQTARILVRTRDGWAVCSPGQWVVKGEPFCSHGDDHDGFCRREFTVEDR